MMASEKGLQLKISKAAYKDYRLKTRASLTGPGKQTLTRTFSAMTFNPVPPVLRS